MKYFLYFLLSIFLFSPSAFANKVEKREKYACTTDKNSRIKCWGNKNHIFFTNYYKVNGRQVDYFDIDSNVGCAILSADKSLRCWGDTSALINKDIHRFTNTKVNHFVMDHFAGFYCLSFENNNAKCGYREDTKVNKSFLYGLSDGFKSMKRSGWEVCMLSFKDEIKCSYSENDSWYFKFEKTKYNKFSKMELSHDFSCATLLNSNYKMCWGDIFQKYFEHKDIKEVKHIHSGYYCILYSDHSFNCNGRNPVHNWVNQSTNQHKYSHLKVKELINYEGGVCVIDFKSRVYCFGDKPEFPENLTGIPMKQAIYSGNKIRCYINLKDQLNCLKGYGGNYYSKDYFKQVTIKYVSDSDYFGKCVLDSNNLFTCLDVDTKHSFYDEYIKNISNQIVRKAQLLDDSYPSRLCIIKGDFSTYCSPSSYLKDARIILEKKATHIEFKRGSICIKEYFTDNYMCDFFPETLKNTKLKYKVLFYDEPKSWYKTGCVVFKITNKIYCWGGFQGSDEIIEVEYNNKKIDKSYIYPAYLKSIPYTSIRSFGYELTDIKNRLSKSGNSFFGDFLSLYLIRSILSTYNNKKREGINQHFDSFFKYFKHHKKVNTAIDFYNITMNRDSLLTLPPTQEVQKEVTNLIANILISTKENFSRDKRIIQPIKESLSLYSQYKTNPNVVNQKNLIQSYKNLSFTITKLVSTTKLSGLGIVLSELISYATYNQDAPKLFEKSPSHGEF